jgi:CYTH domain-containing protein/CHAD domain-containing protein
VRRKDLRALARVARETNAGRDLEVQLAALDAERASMTSVQRAGGDFWRDRLAARAASEMASIRDAVLADFAAVEPRLRARLSVIVREEVVFSPPSPRRFGAVLADAIDAHAQDLAVTLGRVADVSHQDEAHAARIAGKRLRYLVEPIRDRDDLARTLVARTKELQDVLGRMHDAQGLVLALGAAGEEAAVEQARALYAEIAVDPADRTGRREKDPRQGLLELARRARVRRDELFAALARDFLGEGTRALAHHADALSTSLRAAARDDVEIERKYLLSRVPPEMPVADTVEIDQGYVPGERLVERVRRERSAAGTRWLRTVKLGRGVRRVEVEEETTEATFDALWALTVGRRVTKRRHRVEHEGRTWEIDEFTDRDLALAEIELGSADEQPALPPWLAPHVVRDVTDESAYVNLRLAR